MTTVPATGHDLQGKLIAWRRQFHKHPEPGFCEYRTAYALVTELARLGFDVRTGLDAMAPEAVLASIGERSDAFYEDARAAGVPDEALEPMRGGLTAVVADLRAGPGPVVAFRFDMDCLPIVEADDPSHAPATGRYASQNRGWMHACGHDGHMAIGLGVATALAERRQLLTGTVRLIFQPAEEGCPGGARAITARGLLNDVDNLVCVHLGLEAHEVGHVICATDFMATSKFRVTFTGRAAHVVNAPETGRNALIAAATAVLNLQSITPHAHGWFNINVGVLHAGTEQGVTPARAIMDLGLWAETSDVQEYVRGRVHEVVRGAAAAAGVDLDVRHIGEAPSARPDPELAALAHDVASKLPGVDRIDDFATCRAGEDATVMLERVAARGGRGIYVLVGTPIGTGHHTPEFDIDERALGIGTAWLTEIATSLLTQERSKGKGTA